MTRVELDSRHPIQVRTMKRHEFGLDSAIQRLRLLQVEDLTSDSAQASIKVSARSGATMCMFDDASDISSSLHLSFA